MTAHANNTSTYGVLGIGQSNVALPVSALREVADLPHRLTPAPMAPAWSLGAFMLREEMIPVIDLARLLRLDDSTGTRSEGDRVAVVQWRSGVFGLRVDDIYSITSVADDHLQPLENNHTGGNLTPAAFNFHQGDEEHLVYVLDLDVLFALEGVTRSTNATESRGSETTQKMASRDGRPHEHHRALMIECLGVRLSLPAAMVREIQPLETLDPPVLEVEGFMGTTRLRDSHVAVFCPLILARLDKKCTARPGLMVVVTVRGQLMGLAASRILRMIDHAPADLMPLADNHACADATVAGMITHPELGESLLLDGERFATDQDFLTIAAMYAGKESKESVESVVYRRFAFVHFDAFGQYVTPLEQLDEVIAMSDNVTPSTNPGEGWEGTLLHRNRAVSLIDLRKLLKTPHDTPATDVLIVAYGDYRVGFMIDNARHIEYLDAPANSLIIRWRGEQEPDTPPIEQCKRLIVVGTGANKKVMSVLCLETLAALLVDINTPHHCAMIDAASSAPFV
ncbi:chemotaxis protein CheW [uncultured Kushneria sp.]|uniref:chemotaxis protein CheW n=1 Tax=uncultured Kushneria sp. TaxID=905033 RepID=UPI00262408B2|nr:chemotaxis protein CheW [uncultured Kushneria sp.]